jgi:hypothetical protein
MKKTFSRVDKNLGFIFYFFLAIVIASLLFFCIPGCSTSSTKNPTTGTKEPIRILDSSVITLGLYQPQY